MMASPEITDDFDRTTDAFGRSIMPPKPAQSRWVDPVRWFEALGRCACGKPATGTLRGPQNESYGIACFKCGDARVRKAEKAREIVNRGQ
jgi:hypothetical protein